MGTKTETEKIKQAIGVDSSILNPDVRREMLGDVASIVALPIAGWTTLVEAIRQGDLAAGVRAGEDVKEWANGLFKNENPNQAGRNGIEAYQNRKQMLFEPLAKGFEGVRKTELESSLRMGLSPEVAAAKNIGFEAAMMFLAGMRVGKKSPKIGKEVITTGKVISQEVGKAKGFKSIDVYNAFVGKKSPKVVVDYVHGLSNAEKVKIGKTLTKKFRKEVKKKRRIGLSLDINPTKPFYSPLEKVIKRKLRTNKKGEISVEEINKFLTKKNNPGVSPKEVEMSGVLNTLSTPSGLIETKKIPLDSILDVVNRNSVGERLKEYIYRDNEEIRQITEKVQEQSDELRLARDEKYEEMDRKVPETEREAQLNKIQEIKNKIEKLEEQNYNLNKHIRENNLYLPLWKEHTVGKFGAENYTQIDLILKNRGSGIFPTNLTHHSNNPDANMNQINRMQLSDIEDRKTLFIHATQSDWAQKVRSNQARAKRLEIIDIGDVYGDGNPFNTEYSWTIVDPWDPQRNFASRYSKEGAEHELERVIEATRGRTTPSDIFGKETEIGMAHLLDYAVKNGYDRIAWANGKQAKEVWTRGVDPRETLRLQIDGKYEDGMIVYKQSGQNWKVTSDKLRAELNDRDKARLIEFEKNLSIDDEITFNILDYMNSKLKWPEATMDKQIPRDMKKILKRTNPETGEVKKFGEVKKKDFLGDGDENMYIDITPELKEDIIKNGTPISYLDDDTVVA